MKNTAYFLGPLENNKAHWTCLEYEKFLCQRKLSLEEETWWLEHRRSTCEGWHHPWLCYLWWRKEPHTTLWLIAFYVGIYWQKNKQTKTNIARKPERIFVYCPKSFQLYQSKGLESLPFKANLSKRWKEYTKFVSLHRSLPTFQSTVPKPFELWIKTFKRKQVYPHNNFIELLGGLTYLQVFLVVRMNKLSPCLDLWQQS